MKFLVTGTAGNIGATLLKWLSDDGHIIIGGNNYRNGYSANLKGVNAQPSKKISLIGHSLLSVQDTMMLLFILLQSQHWLLVRIIN